MYKQNIKKMYEIGEKVLLVFFGGFHLNNETKDDASDQICSMNKAA